MKYFSQISIAVVLVFTALFLSKYYLFKKHEFAPENIESPELKNDVMNNQKTIIQQLKLDLDGNGKIGTVQLTTTENAWEKTDCNMVKRNSQAETICN